MTKNKVIYLCGLLICTVIVATTAISVASMLTAKPAKEYDGAKYITAEDSGSTLFLKQGDMVHLELTDYGDGGYTWEIVTLDENIVSLVEKTDSEPSGMLGDFGKDIWSFTATNTGSTPLELTCYRAWDNTDVCATFTIQLEVQ